MSDTSTHPPAAAGRGTTAWSTGFAMFAGAVLLVTGICQALAGISALFRDQVYVATPNYIYAFDLTGWGWFHLIFGAALALTGIGVLQGQTWARVVGIVLASLSIIANFLFTPHYPIWSLVIIALDVVVILALVREQRETV
ncbi:DUF7144 family membrane protein [Pseudonocardia acidicola]|uniref:DUF7144 domain-containing protein n=1 Tax=Pseudonocardia acidicola TaxID=2724939 RepID=A0ABX1S5P5_9PSEU|nr:hypothetical protein [Pseudonocardia acidicola]NMH95907.1 hypothetical protein [Pseudonocardia acidicola]